MTPNDDVQHEAGHAIVTRVLPGVDPVHKISIVQRGIGALGYTLQLPLEERYLMTRTAAWTIGPRSGGGTNDDEVERDGRRAQSAVDSTRRLTVRKGPAMFRNILIPIDLSDRSSAAIEAVKSFTDGLDRTVTLLHIIETIPGTTFEEFRSFYRELEQRSLAKLEELAARLSDAGIRSTLEVTYGKPAEQIIEFARERDVDLIVLASHVPDPSRPGHGWSTLSYKVGLLAPCAVLLAKEPSERADDGVDAGQPPPSVVS